MTSMSNYELNELLNSVKWTGEMREHLIAEWNKRRTDIKPIGVNSVRTPCRLRQIIDSFKIFLKEN